MIKQLLVLSTVMTLSTPVQSLASPALLIEKLYDEKNWTQVETTEEGISISVKEINGVSVKAVKVTQLVEINPEILAQVIEDLENYDQFLRSAPGVKGSLLRKSEDYIIGYQHIDVPLIADRKYAFKMFRPDSASSRVDWELVPQKELNGLAINERSGTYIDVGVGSWSTNKQEDGRYIVSYRLVMDPGGWIPDSVSDYINRVSIVGILKDAIIETERRSSVVRG